MGNGCPSRSRREEPGARSRFQQAGNHLLRIRRSVATKIEDGLEVSVSPSMRCRPLAWSWNRATDGRQDGELIARGGTELQPDHTLIGRLGPADRVEVCWGKPAGAGADLATGNVEGLILWDITPAGDQIRARFTCHQPRKRSTIRFAHQEGLILRSARVAGSVDTFCEEDAAKGEWTLARRSSPASRLDDRA